MEMQLEVLNRPRLVRSERHVQADIEANTAVVPADIEVGDAVVPEGHCAALSRGLQQVPRYLVYGSLPFIASITSVSPAVVTMLALPRDAALATKIALPLAIWAPFLSSTLWFQWYYNGRRADGLLDARVRLSTEEGGEAPGLLIIALLASLPSFFDAGVYAHSVRPQHDALFAAIFVVLGIGHWLTWCLTDLQAAWRKLIDGTELKAISDQYWAKPLYSHAYWLNIALREILPIVSALVRAQAFFQLLQSGSPYPLVNALLAIGVYQGAALSVRNFDIRQNHDCSLREGNAFAMQGFLAGSNQLWIRMIGRALNGQLLDDGMAKLGMPAYLRTAVVLGLNAAGLVGMLQRILAAFLMSTDLASIADGKEAFVLAFYASNEATASLSRQMMPASLPLTCGLSSLQALIRAATVKNQIEADNRQQLAPREIQVAAIG